MVNRSWRRASGFLASALLSAAVMVAGEAAAPAWASPASDTIVVHACAIGSVMCSAADDVGNVSVQLTATTTLTSVTIGVLESGVGTVLSVPMQLSSGSNAGGQETTWSVPSPITQGKLPYGDYDVTVDAADSGGASVTGEFAGFLDFLKYPTLTLSSSASAVDYDHQSVTLSGTLTYLLPDGTTQTPAGEPVTLSGQGMQWPLTTSAGGAFSQLVDPVPGPGLTEDDFSAQAAAPDADPLSSPVVSVAFTADELTATDQWAASPVGYLTTATLEGTVTYAGGGSPEPVAGISIQLYQFNAAGQYYQLVASATTGADGSYAVTVQASPAKLRLDVNDSDDTPPGAYFSPSELVPPPLTVTLPVSITHVTAKLSPAGVLNIGGCLSVTPASSLQSIPLTIEYSAASTGPWKALKTVKPAGGCGFPHALGFGVDIPAPLPSAYYRVVYPGSPGFAAAVSATLHEWKYLTRITSFSVAPASARTGSDVTVRGRLWHQVTSWKPFSGQKILILLRYKKKLYVSRIVPVTDQDGRFTVRLPAATGSWFAEYPGGQTDFASQSATVHVTAG